MSEEPTPTGRDLDRVVAEKIMEWSIYHYDKGHPNNCYYMLMDSSFNPVVFSQKQNWGQRKTEQEAWDDVPRFSEDIEAAWQIVEEMERRGWSYDLNSIFKPAACTFGKGLYDEYEHCWHEEYCAAAQTMPHTICLAALKAMGKVAA